jgi:prophage regulatory protein
MMNTMRTDDQHEAPIEYIKLPEVKRISGLSTATIYRMAVAGKFPKQVKIGDAAVAWVRSEVDQWASSKSAARTGQPSASSKSK